MKTKILLLIGLLINVLAFGQDIPAKPNPPKLVNDFVGGLLRQDQIDALEQKLVAYNDSTSSQLTIVIVKSIQPYEPADYALKILRDWGVGQKGKNNGIVLLWVPGERKISIQTGYGMEGVLPDIYAKKIITNIIGPNFKALRYYEGLDQASTQIFKYAAGEYDAEPKEEGDDSLMFFLLILALLILFIYLSRKNKGGGGNIYRDGSPYTTYTGWGRQSGNWGGGGFGGGFGGGGFGGGGGGFGGFGGGSGGGGGASGDY